MIPIYVKKPRRPRRDVTPPEPSAQLCPGCGELGVDHVAGCPPSAKAITYGIDPGPDSSAIVGVGSEGKPFLVEILDNTRILNLIRQVKPLSRKSPYFLAIESMASYGMPVGDPVFVSCYWIGRFAEAWGGRVRLIKAPEVRAHICGTPRGKKAHVRQALMDRYPRTGGGKRPEIGTKSQPGPLFGFKSHAWSALAVAVAAIENEDLGVEIPFSCPAKSEGLP